MSDEKMLSKVRKLLAQAEGTDNPAEAETFTAKATELMMQYAIDEAMLQKSDKVSTDKIITREFVVEGYAKAKMQLLYNIATAMDCKMVYTANSRYSGWKQISLTLVGWESDIDSILVLFASLQMQVTTDMEREAKCNPNVHGRAFKQAFILGFANKVGERLRAQRKRVIKETDDATPGTALAVVERSTAVEADFNRRYPKLGKGNGVSSSSLSGHLAGQAAGTRANLGQTSVGNGRRAIC